MKRNQSTLDQVPRRVHRGERGRRRAAGRSPGPPRPSRCGGPGRRRARRSDRDQRGEARRGTRSRAGRRRSGRRRAGRPRGRSRLDEAEDDDAAELAAMQRGAAHRRQREPVQEARLDVACEVGARVHGREERALDERDGEHEREERVGREAGQLRRGLAGRRSSRASSIIGKIRGGSRWPAGGACGRPSAARAPDLVGVRASAFIASRLRAALAPRSSPAPSSERPVLARKTSSRLGAWSCRFATRRPAASSARTTAGEVAAPAQTHGDPFGERAGASPNRASASATARGRRVGRDRLDRRPPDLAPSARRACPRRRCGRGR